MILLLTIDTITILRGLKEKFEEHHKVVIEDAALEAAVSLSKRYISDRFLPDKAIDVLDEACSKVSIMGYKVPENIEKLEKTLDTLTLEKENYDIRVENARLKEENEILKQKMDALLTFIKDHKEG